MLCIAHVGQFGESFANAAHQEGDKRTCSVDYAVLFVNFGEKAVSLKCKRIPRFGIFDFIGVC